MLVTVGQTHQGVSGRMNKLKMNFVNKKKVLFCMKGQFEQFLE